MAIIPFFDPIRTTAYSSERSGIRSYNLRLLCLGVLVFILWPVLSMAGPRIVAVGDVHGDMDALVSILREAGIINEENRWVGGEAILVQTGDMLDRGLKEREIMDLLMDLKEQAGQSGGRVEVLLGNHEMLNLVGDRRYTLNYTPFADADSETRREAAGEAYRIWRDRRARLMGEPAVEWTPEAREAWMNAHLRGYVERVEAFEPSGRYGSWLRSLPAALRIDDIIFLHGGLSPSAQALTIPAINTRIHEEITRFDRCRQTLIEDGTILPFLDFEEMITVIKQERGRLETLASRTEQENRRLATLDTLSGYASWLSMRTDGPVWFRGFEEWSEDQGKKQIAALRQSYGPVRFVVGHSPTANRRIQARFDNAVFMIDTGMLAMYYRGQPSALEIEGGEITAVYRGSREVLDPWARLGPVPSKTAVETPVRTPGIIWWDVDGQPLPFQTHEEIMVFLRTADVLSMKDIGEGVTRPKKALLEKDGVRMHAIFRDVKVEKDRVELGGRTFLFFRDDAIFECAAYELSRLLGLSNVPPVVPRTINGKAGTLQIWVERAMTEKNRRARKINPVDRVRFEQDWQIIELFDNLVFNQDRNSGNIIIDQSWNIWMIDHTRAFRQYADLQDVSRLKQCERIVWEKLRTLDDQMITRTLKPYLRPYEIEGLLKRRMKLLTHVQKLIDRQGADAILFSR